MGDSSNYICACGDTRPYHACTQASSIQTHADPYANVRPAPSPARDDAEKGWETQLRRVSFWHHAGLFDASCPGVPTDIHLTRPKQLEAKCRLCGFALVAMDSNGAAIHVIAAHVAAPDELTALRQAKTHWHMAYKGLEDSIRALADEWERNPARFGSVADSIRAALGDA